MQTIPYVENRKGERIWEDGWAGCSWGGYSSSSCSACPAGVDAAGGMETMETMGPSKSRERRGKTAQETTADRPGAAIRKGWGIAVVSATGRRETDCVAIY